MRNQVWCIILLGIILCMPLTLADGSLNPFADKKIFEPIITEDMSNFIKKDFNIQYGVIRLSKTFFWIETDRIAEYSLTKNTEYCMVNCEAEGKVKLYLDGILFDNVQFKKLNGEEASIESSEYLTSNSMQDNFVNIPNTYKEVCITYKANGTNPEGMIACHQEVDTYKLINQPIKRWTPYNGEILPAGEYSWKIKGKKAEYQSVDFIPIRYDKEFSEWAVWTASLNVGLKHYWKLDDGSGTTGANSINISAITAFKEAVHTTWSHVTLLGSHSVQVDASAGAGLNFSAVLPPNNATWSISAWYRFVNVEDNAKQVMEYGTWGEYMLGIVDNTGERARFYMGKGANVAGQGYQLATAGIDFMDSNTWYHVVITYNGSTYQAYINGTKTAEKIQETTSFVGWICMGGACADGGLWGGSGANDYMDEIGIWNRSLSTAEITDLYNGGTGITYSSLDFAINQTAPVNNYISYTNLLNFNCTVTMDYPPLYLINISLWNNASGDFKLNKTYTGFNNNTVINQTFTSGSYNWSCQACISDGTCKITPARQFTFIDSIQKDINYTRYAYETDRESFTTNFTYSYLDYTKISVALNYNGTLYPASLLSGTNENLKYNVSITIPKVDQDINMSLYFVYNFTGTPNLFRNSTFNNQSILNTSFWFCPLGQYPVVNFTFKDEVNLSNVNAKADSFSINYWLGNDSSVNISYSYVNTSVNYNYPFCFEPNKTVKVFINTFKYSNPLFYPLRTYSNNFTALNNITTNRVFYLLSTSDGMYVSFQIVNIYGQPISGATVQVSTTALGILETKTTDDAGIATFFLNINNAHSIQVTKAGYTSTTQTITPTQSLYTIVLGGGTTTATYNNTIEGIYWYRYPRSGILSPGTYTFGFNVTAQLGNLHGCMFNLTNNTGSVINSTNTTGDFSCNLSLSWNILNGDNLYGKLYLDLGEGYMMVESDGNWKGIYTNASSSTTLKNILGYLSDAGNWIDPPTDTSVVGYQTYYASQEYKKYEFTKMVAFFLILALLMASLNIGFSFDTVNPGIFLWAFPIIMTIMSIPPAGLNNYFTNPGFFFIYEATPWNILDNLVVMLYSWFIFVTFYFATKRRDGV